MTIKEKLYYLIKSYLLGQYDTNTFSSLFTNTFNLEVEGKELNEFEEEAFEELLRVTCRFSPYEEDSKLPNVYFNEQQVKTKAEVTFR